MPYELRGGLSLLIGVFDCSPQPHVEETPFSHQIISALFQYVDDGPEPDFQYKSDGFD